jgi:hypoxanthine-DNA glycosylase
MYYNHAEHGFGPVIDSESRILILGSFPSVFSRAESFYYMHPNNRFWPILSAIFGVDFVHADRLGKTSLLHKCHIALYDVIESCDISGSADSSIRNIITADLDPLIRSARIRRIYLNGSKAFILFSRYFPEYAHLATVLPSTSAANAAFGLSDLVEKWRVIL